MKFVSHAWFHKQLCIYGHQRRALHAAAISATESTFAVPALRCATLYTQGQFIIHAMAPQDLNHPITDSEARATCINQS